MAKTIDRAFAALDNVRKAGGDQKKVEAALREVESALEAAEREADQQAQQLKSASAAPKAQAPAEEDAASTKNVAPVEDPAYDQERLLNAPLSAGERAALNDPAYRGGAELDWMNPAEPFQSPIETALQSPKLALSRARRI